MFFVLAAALVSVSAAHQIWPVPDDFQLPQLPPDASDGPSSCTDADFPHDLNGLKVDGLKAQPTVKSADDCRAACCDAGPSCQVFEWTPTRASGSTQSESISTSMQMPATMRSRGSSHSHRSAQPSMTSLRIPGTCGQQWADSPRRPGDPELGRRRLLSKEKLK